MKKIIEDLFLFLFYFLLIIFFNYSQLNAQCGKERWDVKTLTDSDTSYIDFENIISTTISEQCGLPKPSKIKNKPRLKSERTVYELIGYVTSFKLEDDRDYHVVIEDPDTEVTMVIEILDPDCPGIESTSRYKIFKEVRDWFTKNFHPTKTFKTTKKKVKLTGVGFFDFIHGQRGMAPNGREIHPVMSMEFAK
jgi:hypothetical protein